MDMLRKKFTERKNVCVGLDTEHAKIPDCVLSIYDRMIGIGPRMRMFNRDIVEATCDIVCMYKYNLGFYLREGMQGIWALEFSVKDARAIAPDVPIILDGKFGDVGLSSSQYAKFAFEVLGVDAVTVNPWGGRGDGLDAFLKYKNKGIFVWCRGSNEGAREIQDLKINTVSGGALYDQPIYELVAERVSGFNEYEGPMPESGWNANRNCGVVMGATYPDQLARVRQVVGDMPILATGIGAQKGDLKKAVKAAIYTDLKTGQKSLPAIFNSSRGIIYASEGEDFAESARQKAIEMNDEIMKVLGDVGA
jgi:orotidine-5'-phosphate decarboxylase